MAYTTIDNPELYFQTKLYTGDGSATQAQTFDGSEDMAPDLVWIKSRSNAEAHSLTDSVRGVTKWLESNSTAAEQTNANTMKAFGTNGFSVGLAGSVGDTSQTYVAWCWKANGSGSSNEAGSINTTATSANTTSGFSISTFTGNAGAGATIGHGLGAVPHFFMNKNLADAGNWGVYHHKNTSAPETDHLHLDTTAATADDADFWNDTAPTSTLITLDTHGSINGSSEAMVNYAWTEVQGFSKFGSYIGNGNADGTFVYTGFKVRWVLIKNAGGVETWNIWDSKRTSSGGGNLVDKDLSTTHTRAEQTGSAGVKVVDFLSNGFKIRGSNTEINQSGNTHIYMAFAEAPLVNSNGVPCNAR